MNFNPTFDLAQNLDIAAAENAKVELHLRNGKSLAGLVGARSTHFVLLTQLSGKEFYDALVRIEDISAVEVRVRSK